MKSADCSQWDHLELFFQSGSFNGHQQIDQALKRTSSDRQIHGCSATAQRFPLAWACGALRSVETNDPLGKTRHGTPNATKPIRFQAQAREADHSIVSRNGVALWSDLQGSSRHPPIATPTAPDYCKSPERALEIRLNHHRFPTENS